MFSDLLVRLFGSKNDRTLARYNSVLKEVNQLEKQLQDLSSESFMAKVVELKSLLANEEKPLKYQALAFALTRESALRFAKMRHYDVQILGGAALCEGKIAEMGTGEGKTLVATLPAAFYALSGKKVFVVTVNDYLAQRDSAWMRCVYEGLGLSVGVVYAQQDPMTRRQAYAADIIYVTNHELGFDYLRDQMVVEANSRILPDLDFALIDEVDSILIDEARTPLIISGPQETDVSLYVLLNKIVQGLYPCAREAQAQEGDFVIDEKARQLYLTEQGHLHLEELLQQAQVLHAGQSLYQPSCASLLHHCYAALRAHHLYKCDHDYIIYQNKVMIIDEHTGRVAAGRRWSDGLHQAVEAKEGVKIEQENMTLASITFQNFFRLFKKLGGMTGTADTEAYELHEIYGLDVVVIPPNRPCVRKDHPDAVYCTEQEKFEAIVDAVQKEHYRNRPVLVGTVAIEKSEQLSAMFHNAQIHHVVLNAKQHEQEAQIVAQAGRKGAVTIATNMAGRGTDIILGGTFESFCAHYPEKNPDDLRDLWLVEQKEVKDLGGLFILGSERHESRRIDNQLRGRAGRQGDPGESQFFVSFDDLLMRAFVPENYLKMFKSLSTGYKEPIVSPMLSRAIEKAQRKIEGYHFEIRKQRLEEDNVVNDQRNVVYACRDEILDHQEPQQLIDRFMRAAAEQYIANYVTKDDRSLFVFDELKTFFKREFSLELETHHFSDCVSLQELSQVLFEDLFKLYQVKIQNFEKDALKQFERSLMLHYLDHLWREHLTQLELTKQHVSLRGYAQKDPRQEYKIEAFGLFQRLMNEIALSITGALLRARFITQEEAALLEEQEAQENAQRMAHLKLKSHDDQENVMDAFGKQSVSRNQLCSCGSQKKYKHCCGQLTHA